jgi:hypothetical protein
MKMDSEHLTRGDTLFLHFMIHPKCIVDQRWYVYLCIPGSPSGQPTMRGELAECPVREEVAERDKVQV